MTSARSASKGISAPEAQTRRLRGPFSKMSPVYQESGDENAIVSCNIIEPDVTRGPVDRGHGIKAAISSETRIPPGRPGGRSNPWLDPVREHA